MAISASIYRSGTSDKYVNISQHFGGGPSFTVTYVDETPARRLTETREFYEESDALTMAHILERQHEIS